MILRPLVCQRHQELVAPISVETPCRITNGISKLVFTILSAVAEAERDRVRERVTQVKRDQRQRNRYLGGIVPFGFRVGRGGALVPDAAEQALIAHARALRAGGATLRAIQAVLETQHGRKLSLDALHRVLGEQSTR